MFDTDQGFEGFFEQFQQSAGEQPPVADHSGLDVPAMLASDERYSAVDHGGYTVVYDHTGSESGDCPYTIERIVFDNGFVL